MNRSGITLTGPGFTLRPVTLADAGTIVSLRTSNPEHTQFLHETSSSITEQENWLRAYLERENDYYFVVERRSKRSAEGLIGLYDLDRGSRRAEWGRWVLAPGSLAAVESVYLLQSLAFECLGLQETYSRTVAGNRRVVSFHDSCGFKRSGTIASGFERGGVRHDLVLHSCDLTTWTSVKTQLLRYAERTAACLRS